MYPPRNNTEWVGGPSNHQKLYASSLNEKDSLFHSYEHLMDVPQPQEALMRLRKIASLVKPIMRKRAWTVQVLTEFMPDDERLLGLNINKTFKICIRLRYSHSPGTFMPIEQCVDTMLHELSHIIFGAHDANFHALWDELRSEHETLLLRGYTGEGFLTRGQKLGGGRVPPPHEMRRMARASAENRRVLQKGSGRKIGGKQLPPGVDVRRVLADAADRRATVDRGCASGTAQAGKLAEQTGRQTFKTKAEEDDANDRAIAEALFDLLEEEEAQKMRGTFITPSALGGLIWSPEKGLDNAGTSETPAPMSEEEQMKWALQESVKENTPRSAKRPVPSESDDDWTMGKSTKAKALSPRVTTKQDTPVIDLTGDDEVDNHQTNEIGAAVQRPVTHLPPDPSSWACQICTCINPSSYLACDACGVERPVLAARPTTSFATSKNIARNNIMRQIHGEDSGWHCRECGTLMEKKWWTCSGCGLMKDTS